MGDPRQRGWAEEFKREAVRLLSTSGRTVGEMAADLGVGKSTLTHWRRRLQETELLAGPHPDAEKELARLRRENEILRQERDLLEKATVGSTGQRNGLGKGSGWCFVAKGFPWPGVEPQGDRVEIILAVNG
ncbi:transposase, partial [Roseomonas marmotae]